MIITAMFSRDLATLLPWVSLFPKDRKLSPDTLGTTRMEICSQAKLPHISFSFLTFFLATCLVRDISIATSCSKVS